MDDIKIDQELVRSLLDDQHPDLAGLEIREVDGGWDNMMWRLGDELAVRLPRLTRAPALMRSEQRWLPALAPHLPLPVPTPVRVGEPSALFPETWTVTSWVAGVPADQEPISRPDAADSLAKFLRALHRAAPDEAPANPTHGGALQTHANGIEGWLAVLASDEHATAARRVWDDAVAAPEWDRAPSWIHGDLHPANVVVADGTLSGVIDFGELCAGDPAADLAAAWVLLPAGTAPRFLDAYGIADDAMIRRARGWAVLRALVLITIGQMWEQGLPGGKRTWGPAGRAALERVLSAA
ncbi:aminoglycoside phosphotransferase family protein [Dactylosporangium sp. CA-233914]|uniref:aminoglycoside phosphotransferase family protein n=1 Tax=Dactylosporangium sp. CA-233914 TaxID=3239934 RepID=UPI003D90E52A